LKAKTDGSEVDLKRPISGPQQALTYVGRYTHRIAIATSRRLSIEDGRVRFCWKDYRRQSAQRDDFNRRRSSSALPDPRAAG
jgi:hypothetical protein